MTLDRNVESPDGTRSALRFSLFAALLFLCLIGAQPAHAQGCVGVAASAPDKVKWTPNWCQEFTGSAASPDTTAWSFDLGGGGWGNNEIEVYCGPPGYAGNPPDCPSTFSTTTNTVYIDGNGRLAIQPIFANGKWISTRMKTQGIKNFQYGRIEASIQLPDTTDQGLWPAFWSLGTNITSTPWPTCGEADIMENWPGSVFNGPGPNGNRATIHTMLTGGTGRGGAYNFPSGQHANTGFHTYGVIWSANLMQYYVDDPTKPYFAVTPSDLSANDIWPFNASAFLLANVAVGGNLGGSTANLVNPQPMMIDFVRQYTATAVPAPTFGDLPSITVKAGASTGNSVTITPNLTPGTGFVYFTCSTNAPKSLCTISTTNALNPHVINSSNPAESLTLTINTVANAAFLGLPQGNRLPFWLLFGSGLMFLAIVAAFILRARRNSIRWKYGLAAAAMVAASVAIGCGGGTTQAQPSPGGGTTPGSFSITVNAYTESNVTGSPDATAQVGLTVN